MAVRGGKQVIISKELLKYVADADYSTKLNYIEFSTNLREIVTVGYMLEQGGEK